MACYSYLWCLESFWRVVFLFCIQVDAEAEKEAKSLGVKIMTAEIIYHLFDEFTAYFQSMKEEKKYVCSISFFLSGLHLRSSFLFFRPFFLSVLPPGSLQLPLPRCYLPPPLVGLCIRRSPSLFLFFSSRLVSFFFSARKGFHGMQSRWRGVVCFQSFLSVVTSFRAVCSVSPLFPFSLLRNRNEQAELKRGGRLKVL